MAVEDTEIPDPNHRQARDQSVTVGSGEVLRDNRGYVALGSFSTPARRAAIAELRTRCMPVTIYPWERIPTTPPTLHVAGRFGCLFARYFR